MFEANYPSGHELVAYVQTLYNTKTMDEVRCPIPSQFNSGQVVDDSYAPYHRSLILDRLDVEDSYAPYHRSLWTGCRGGFIARDL
jgi:hypothetical protein